MYYIREILEIHIVSFLPPPTEVAYTIQRGKPACLVETGRLS